MRQPFSPRLRGRCIRSSVSVSSRRRQRQSWPISATTTCTFFTGTEPRDGRSMLLMMASLLKEQLKIGGRLIIPLGRDPKVQELVRITRISENEYAREDLADVRFVPLIGQEGWAPAERERTRPRPARPFTRLAKDTLAQKIANACEPFESIEAAPLDRLLARIGDARVVLLGEASHGTSEFYRMRDRISRELIAKKGFRFVAIEGDWPDAARVDHYVRHMEYPPSEWTAFARFPTWMWRNNEVRAFVDWLRAHNAPLKAADRAAFHGLDLYSLYDSIRAVLKYLDEIDPSTAAVARERYGCLTPLAVRSRHLRSCFFDRRLSDLRIGSHCRPDRSLAQAARVCGTRR